MQLVGGNETSMNCYQVLIGSTPRLGRQLEMMHVFSLGAVTYWALTFQEMRNKRDIPPELTQILTNMLQKVPALRPSVEDVLETCTFHVGQLGLCSTFIN